MPQKHAPRGPIKLGALPPPKHADVLLISPPQTNTHPNGIDRSGYDPTRCTATSKIKKVQCTKQPVPGTNVCRYHGGAAPQVARKGRERLVAYLDRAIDSLFELAEQKEFPSTRYQAVRDVLDRVMGRPAETVDLNVNAAANVAAILQSRHAKRIGASRTTDSRE